MTGDGGPDVGRVGRVWTWIGEHAAARHADVSVGVLCETAVDRLKVSGAALIVADGGSGSAARHTTDDLSATLADLQRTVGEGPAIDALNHGPLLAVDLGAASSARRWPLFTPLAGQAGAATMHALPLSIGAIRVGVLTLHQVVHELLDAEAIADALVFADLALRLLLAEQDGLPAELADGDGGTLGFQLSDAQVHQATGMVAAQLDVKVDEAFARLRARAFADQRSLAELAGDVVARRIRFAPDGSQC